MRTVTRRPPRAPVLTAAGALATHATPLQQLRRSVLACLLWEDSFYEAGAPIADRIATLAHQVPAAQVAALAVEARSVHHVRHAALWLCAAVVTHPQRGGQTTRQTIAQVVQRPDELAELCAMLARGGEKLSKIVHGGVRRGLADALRQFSRFQLARYRGEGDTITLRDVLRLVRPKPATEAQRQLWGAVVRRELRIEAGETWERDLSAGGAKTVEEKRTIWTRLLQEKKLGGLALLRNLRNMCEAGVDRALMADVLATHPFPRALPFRFIAAAREVPQLEEALDAAFQRVMATEQQLQGKTVLVVDVSGSMGGTLSRPRRGKHGEAVPLTRLDAAAGLAMMVREACPEVAVYCTAGSDAQRVHATKQYAARHGFALRDLVHKAARELGGGGIFLTQCLAQIVQQEQRAARIVVLTDEQDCETDPLKRPANAPTFGTRNYLVNIAPERNGISYTPAWVHVDGFSAATVRYLCAVEQSAGEQAPQLAEDMPPC